MGYRYKVVPFIGQTRGSLAAAEVAKQLESAISEHASHGWEFYQLSDVNIEVQPGCLSGLFGGKVEYVRFDQLIFRTDLSVAVKPSPGALDTFSSPRDSVMRGRESSQEEPHSKAQKGVGDAIKTK